MFHNFLVLLEIKTFRRSTQNCAHTHAEFFGRRARIDLGVEIDFEILKRAEDIVEHAREIERANVAFQEFGLRRARPSFPPLFVVPWRLIDQGEVGASA